MTETASPAARRFSAVTAWVCRAALVLAAAVLATLVIAVFSRLVIRWAGWSTPMELEHYRRAAFGAFVFLAIGPGLRGGAHLAIEAFAARLPEAVQAVLIRAVAALLAAFLLVMCWAGVLLTVEGWSTRLPGSGWPESVFYVTMPLGGAVGAIAALEMLWLGDPAPGREPETPAAAKEGETGGLQH